MVVEAVWIALRLAATDTSVPAIHTAASAIALHAATRVSEKPTRRPCTVRLWAAMACHVGCASADGAWITLEASAGCCLNRGVKITPNTAVRQVRELHSCETRRDSVSARRATCCDSCARQASSLRSLRRCTPASASRPDRSVSNASMPRALLERVDHEHITGSISAGTEPSTSTAFNTYAGAEKPSVRF